MQNNILDIIIRKKILTFDHIDNDTVLSVVCRGTSVVARVRRSGLLKHAPLSITYTEQTKIINPKK